MARVCDGWHGRDVPAPDRTGWCRGKGCQSRVGGRFLPDLGYPANRHGWTVDGSHGAGGHHRGAASTWEHCGGDTS
jgi:hypothetical protein